MGSCGPSTGGRAGCGDRLQCGGSGAALASWEGLRSLLEGWGPWGDVAGTAEPAFGLCESAAESRACNPCRKLSEPRSAPPNFGFGVLRFPGRTSQGPAGSRGPKAGPGVGGADGWHSEAGGEGEDPTNPLRLDSVGERSSFRSSWGVPGAWICEESSGRSLRAGRRGALRAGGSWPRATSIWLYTSTLGKITLLLGESRYAASGRNQI